MTRWLDDREQRVWRDFLHVHRLLDSSLAGQLAESGISPSDFAVLVVLSDVPDGRRRAFELGRELQWEKSRLSHHLTRMERRGLVTREDCGSDRRGAFVVLTDAGRRAVERAAPGHVEHVRRHVFDVLAPEQVDALAQICATLRASLEQEREAGCATTACAEAPDPASSAERTAACRFHSVAEDRLKKSGYP